MAEFCTNQLADRLLKGLLDLDGAGASDLRALLLTTDAEDQDYDNLAAVISAGGVEATHTGYSRQELGGDTVNLDDANDRAEYDVTDPVYSGVESGSDIVSSYVYLHVDGTNGNDVPLGHYDTNFPLTPNGSDITLQVNAEGLIQASTA